MSLSQLLREQRLKAAASQLRATDNSIDDIAYGCGFGDLSHFYRYFKQYTGKTPSHYRHLEE